MPSTASGKRSSRKNFPGYKIYYSRLLKDLQSIHGPGLMMSKESVAVMDSMMNDMFEKITNQAVHMMRTNNRKTLTERDIQFAVKLIYPGQLGTQGVIHGEKAIRLLKKGSRPPNSLESSKNSSEASFLDPSSDLDFDTFRSNVGGHSSPLENMAGGRTSDSNVMESSDSIASNNSNDEDNLDEARSDCDHSFDVRQSRSGNQDDDHEEDGSEVDAADPEEIEGNNGQEIQLSASALIEQHLRNRPVVQQGLISALVGCIPNFLMHRRRNNDTS